MALPQSLARPLSRTRCHQHTVPQAKQCSSIPTTRYAATRVERQYHHYSDTSNRALCRYSAGPAPLPCPTKSTPGAIQSTPRVESSHLCPRYTKCCPQCGGKVNLVVVARFSPGRSNFKATARPRFTARCLSASSGGSPLPESGGPGGPGGGSSFSGGGTGPGGGGGGSFRRKVWEGEGGDPYLRSSAGPQEEQENDDDVARERVLVLDVGGMSCGGCAAAVKKILESHESVTVANVNLMTETALARVSIPAIAASAEEVGARVRELGEALAARLTDAGFDSALRGDGADVAAHGGSMKASAAKREERLQRIHQATQRMVQAWGLAAICIAGHLSHVIPGLPGWVHLLCGDGVHAALSVAALLGPGRALLVDGWRSLRQGAPNMNTLVSVGAVAALGMSAVAAAVPRLGWPRFFEEPVMLLAFVLLGRSVEERAKLQASSDMQALLTLLPPSARLLNRQGGPPADGAAAPGEERRARWSTVPTEVVQVGDLIEVLPGDRVPLDGTVVGGRSSVEEAALTGEPLPVTKQRGDPVYAGAVNCDGALTVEVATAGDQTMLAHIVRQVEEAQTRVAPVQRLADRVSGQFVYTVMGLSAATFAFWSTLGPRLFPALVLATPAAAAAATTTTTAGAAAVAGVSASAATSAALMACQMACNVLVVACPCALGLATPTAVLVGTSIGARHGLLIRGGDILEKASSIDTVVLDKTGTLTRGQPKVVHVHTLPPSPGGPAPPPTASGADELLALAGQVEAQSQHPLAKAIWRAAEEVPPPEAAAGRGQRAAPAGVQEGSFVQEPGRGAAALVGGCEVAVGSLSWVRQRGCAVGPEAEAALRAVQGAAQAGHTLVHVGAAGRLLGVIEIADELRGDAAAAVAALTQRGLQVHILSGDEEGAVRKVGAQLQLAGECLHAGVTPQGKTDFVQGLQREGRRVAVVGDGVNDIAALATADVGMAMGGGVGAAGEVASIVLTRDSLMQVVAALELSKSTFGKIQQNLLWAFGYNLVGIPLAAGAAFPAFGVALTPSIAGALMGVSSLGVMGNSLLLRVTAGAKLDRLEAACENSHHAVE